jgi:hypothetical protein
MAWGPPGETKTTSEPVTKGFLEEELKRYEYEGLRDFIGCVRDGDELSRVVEGNRHRSTVRYVGRRGRFSYTTVISFRMS